MSKYKIDPLVLVGVPTLMDRPLNWAWMEGYMGMAFPLGCSVARARPYGQKVADARNAIVEEALGVNAQYVLFISDDVIAPSRTFERLWMHKVDIVTGVYWTKTYPTMPYIWKGLMDGPYLDWKFGEFFEIDWAGCDCLLVHTDVFRKIDPPWFSHDWAWGKKDVPTNLPTEDMYFYTKTREAGYKLWCDAGIQCDHIDRATGAKFGLTERMPQYVGYENWKGIDGEKLIADVGCGKSTPYFGDKVKIHRIDQNPKLNPDILCDVRAIPQPPETYDIVHVSHVLEHFRVEDAHLLIKEWLRILKVNGELIIIVPNLVFAAQEVLRAAEDPRHDASYAYWQLYGNHQTYEDHEYHKCGYTANGLKRVFARAGIYDVEVTETDPIDNYPESKTNCINLMARVIKKESSKPYSILEHWEKKPAKIKPDKNEGNGWAPQPLQLQQSDNS